MNTTKILKTIREKEEQYSFNDYVENYIDMKELKVIDNTIELEEYLQDLNEDMQITDTDVIYHATAMEYLMEHDTSLQESMELAHDMGCDMKTLNSETLASLLKSQNNAEDYQEFINEVITELDK
jgi:hypothetical protein